MPGHLPITIWNQQSIGDLPNTGWVTGINYRFVLASPDSFYEIANGIEGFVPDLDSDGFYIPTLATRPDGSILGVVDNFFESVG